MWWWLGIVSSCCLWVSLVVQQGVTLARAGFRAEVGSDGFGKRMVGSIIATRAPVPSMSRAAAGIAARGWRIPRLWKKLIVQGILVPKL